MYEKTYYRRALVLYDEASAAGLAPGSAEAGAIACLVKLGRSEEAEQRARRLVQRYPTSVSAIRTLAHLCFVAGRDAEAISLLERGLARQPKDAELRNALAWLLATTPSEAHRNGARAVQLASGLSSSSRQTQADYRDTLAAAYAASGRFAEAVRLQESLMSELLADRDSSFSGRSLIRQRLAGYRAGQPWRRRPLSTDS